MTPGEGGFQQAGGQVVKTGSVWQSLAGSGHEKGVYLEEYHQDFGMTKK